MCMCFRCVLAVTCSILIYALMTSDVYAYEVHVSCDLTLTAIQTARDMSAHISGEGAAFGDRAQSSPTQNVAFLKVHKAGSTTAMNIFVRFAVDNQLNIALPNRSNGPGFNYIGYGNTVKRDNLVPLPPGESYNVLCNHVVYNRDAFREIMPNNTAYVAIIREPTNHFISASQYYGFDTSLKKLAGNDAKTKTHSQLIGDYLRSSDADKKKLKAKFVHNRMMYDFGLPRMHWEDVTIVRRYIEELDRDFKLVMLMEYFDFNEASFELENKRHSVYFQKCVKNW
jgi:galactosylceramide sulfotransferase